MTSGMISFPSSGSTDFLNTASWDTAAEGPQNFHDFAEASHMHPADREEFPFSYGHSAHGPAQDLSGADDYQQGKWTPSPSAVGGEPMRRAASRTSAGSPKHRITKSSCSFNKGRRGPNTLSPASLASLDLTGAAAAFQGYQMSPNMVDPPLCLDSDITSPPFCQMMSMDGLPMPCDMNSLHVNPAQITHLRLDTESVLACRSRESSWDAFSAVSRTPSPMINRDGWSGGSGIASPPDSQASPTFMANRSPRTLVNVDQTVLLDDDLASTYIMMGHEDALAMQTLGHRPSNSDGESARDHPYYKVAAPGTDGLYHCPFEAEAGCNHKPEKLKCNYDKFVDSHLKPYRCKVETCSDARFSSTACLLRHEREAHAMHGHGDKPFLCTHEGCDRSMPGNGFPRQWNLRDHMKRVHHTGGPSSQSVSGSPPAGVNQAPHQLPHQSPHQPSHQPPKSRKRKTDVPEAVTAAARKPSVRPSPVLGASQQKVAKAHHEWRERQRVLGDIVPMLTRPDDGHALDHIREARQQLDAMERLYGSSPDAFTRRLISTS